MLSHVKKVAEELGINPYALDDAYRDCLIQIKRTLEKPEMPKVLINGFGTFHTTIEIIERHIRREIWRYKNGQISREVLKRMLERLFPVRRRLLYEQKEAEKRKVPKNPIQRAESIEQGQVAMDKSQTGRTNARRGRRTSGPAVCKKRVEKRTKASRSLRERED